MRGLVEVRGACQAEADERQQGGDGVYNQDSG